MRLPNSLFAWPLSSSPQKETNYIIYTGRKKVDIAWLVPSRKASDKQMRILR